MLPAVGALLISKAAPESLLGGHPSTQLTGNTGHNLSLGFLTKGSDSCFPGPRQGTIPWAGERFGAIFPIDPLVEPKATGISTRRMSHCAQILQFSTFTSVIVGRGERGGMILRDTKGPLCQPGSGTQPDTRCKAPYAAEWRDDALGAKEELGRFVAIYRTRRVHYKAPRPAHSPSPLYFKKSLFLQTSQLVIVKKPGLENPREELRGRFPGRSARLVCRGRPAGGGFRSSHNTGETLQTLQKPRVSGLENNPRAAGDVVETARVQTAILQKGSGDGSSDPATLETPLGKGGTKVALEFGAKRGILSCREAVLRATCLPGGCYENLGFGDSRDGKGRGSAPCQGGKQRRGGGVPGQHTGSRRLAPALPACWSLRAPVDKGRVLGITCFSSGAPARDLPAPAQFIPRSPTAAS